MVTIRLNTECSNTDLSFLRVKGSRAFVHEEGHHEKLDQRSWAYVLVGYNNDSPTYRLLDSTNGKIVRSRNVTFIEQVQSNTPSTIIVDDNDERRMNSDDLENVYDGITSLESTDSDNVEDDNNSTV